MAGLLFCYQDENEYFGHRFKPVLVAITRANDTCVQLIREARQHAVGEDDNVLWMLAGACIAEFEDIFLLAANGRGTGSTKLLRAFYERVVTFSYLAMNREKIRQFVSYSDVHWHKLLTEARRVHSEFSIPQEDLERIQTAFEKVKDRYQRVKCSTCKTFEPNGSWTKLPISDMASKVHEVLRQIAFGAYLEPTFHIHTTHYGIVDICEKRPDGGLEFHPLAKQRNMAAQALSMAHILVMHLADMIDQAFKLGRHDLVEEVGVDWKQSWETIEHV